MAPRSPTRAFEPTPALEHNRHNFSPFNNSDDMLSFDNYANSLPKEVRFSEPSSGNFHRAHSIATENVPLLPAVSSASAVPRTAFRITNPTPGIDITAYIENCRNLNEQLRQAHEAERRAWNIERTALQARIADLEFKLNMTTNNKRRSSNEFHPPASHHSLKTDIRALYQANNSGVQKPVSDTVVPTVAPVWKGPESTPPTTRVFQTEETNGNHLPSISEDEAFPSLSKEVSPSTVENSRVPVEQVDSTLDGITLRSAALTSSFETKIASPQFGSPARSPPTKPVEEKPARKALHIDASKLLPPLEEKLKRHAGHTPLALPPDSSIAPSDQTTEIPTPVEDKPVEPAPTKRPPLRPSEYSDSYFSTTSDADPGAGATIHEDVEAEAIAEEEDELQSQFQPEDDKPLKGPLMLDPSARTKAASTFLEKLDAKLEAVRESSPDRRQSFVSVASSSDAPPTAEPTKPLPTVSEAKVEPDDDMPRLRMKKSTNFGSAYGFNMPGRV